jgi:hypothetical protein
VPGLLQYSFDPFAFGEHHQPGGVFIESMHNEYFMSRVPPFYMIAQEAVGGLRLFLLGRNGKHAGMFVDNDEVFVFKDDADAAILLLFGDLVPSYFYFLFGLEWMVVQGNSPAVDKNLPISQERLDFVPAPVGYLGPQELQKLSAFSDVEFGGWLSRAPRSLLMTFGFHDCSL